ncbi:MAG: ABC transporter substrate-binding protein [Proteobacteria bacterium]|nr:ABC transporter substrate-binding protein [Pseudomonadota bacterium]
MKLLASVALGLAIALGATASAQTLRIGLQEDPDTLDGAKNWSFVGRVVMQSICDKLVDIAPDQSIVPMLATAWETAEDGKSITMKLRPGVKFHDGEPVNAAAVKFSLDRALTLPDSRRRSEISAVTNVAAVDDLTVRIELATPFSPLFAQFADRAGIIVSPKAVQALGDQFGSKPVCAGPYKFVERVVQDRIVLEKFADYWDKDSYYVQRVVFLPIPDTTVRFANLQSGQLELVERLAANDIPTLKKNKNLAYTGITGMGYTGLTFNIANGPRADNPFGRDKRVRQALDLAIDRNIINEVVYSGEYTVGNQPVPPTNPNYNKALPLGGRDLARAKALLREAGVTNPTLNLLVPNTDDSRRAAEMIQSMARDAGIEVKLLLVEFITMLQQAKEGKFDADFVGWSGRIDTDANIHTLLACKVPGNDGHYCNAKLDELLDAGRRSSNGAERKKIYEGVMQTLVEEKPILYLWHAKWLWGLSAKLEGFTPYPDGIIRLRGVKLKS